MLSIKKRFPYNKLYIAGSAAFITGYAAFMSIVGWIPQRYAIDQFTASQTEVKPVETNTESAPEQKPETSQESTAAPTRQTPVANPAPVAETPTTPVVTDSIVPIVPEVPVTPEVPVIPEVPEIPIVDPIIDAVQSIVES